MSPARVSARRWRARIQIALAGHMPVSVLPNLLGSRAPYRCKAG